MTVVLAPLATGPFTLFSDPTLHEQVSELSWKKPVHVGRLTRPSGARKNLFPDGSWEGGGTGNILVTNAAAPTRVTDWSSHGPHSLAIVPSGATAIQSSPGLSMGALPRRRYSAGVTVRNTSPDEQTYRLSMTFSGQTFSVDVPIPADEIKRVELLNVRCPHRQVTSSVPWGTTSAIALSWSLQALSATGPADTFNIDEFFIGESAHSTYTVDSPPTLDLSAATDVIKVYIRNATADTYSDIRVLATPAAPDSARPWIQVSPDPDLIPWQDAYATAVAVADSMNPADSSPLYFRAVADEWVPPGQHRLILRLIGEITPS